MRIHLVFVIFLSIRTCKARICLAILWCHTNNNWGTRERKNRLWTMDLWYIGNSFTKFKLKHLDTQISTMKSPNTRLLEDEHLLPKNGSKRKILQQWIYCHCSRLNALLVTVLIFTITNLINVTFICTNKNSLTNQLILGVDLGLAGTLWKRLWNGIVCLSEQFSFVV